MANTKNAIVVESVASPMNIKPIKFLSLFLASLMLTCSLSACGSSQKKCSVCRGTGYYQKKTCVFCHGTGYDR